MRGGAGHPGAGSSPSGVDPPVHDTANSHAAVPGDANAESFAQSLLGNVDASGILHLLSLLPSEAPARGSRTKGHGSEFSFTTGAYTYDHGARLGLRQNCRVFPFSTRVLCEYVLTRAPEAGFTTLALFRDLDTKVHVDLGNDPEQPNNIFRISDFLGGGLWLQCGSGSQPCPLPGEGHRMGRVLNFQQDRISFDAQVPHCVMPWKGGSRVVLVAFTVKNHNRLAAQDSMDLRDLGFQIPMLANSTVSAADSESVGVRKCPPSGFPSSSPARVPVVLVPNEAATKPTPRDPTAGPGSTSLSTRTKEAASLADSTSGVMHGDGLPCKPSFLEIFCGSAGLSVEVRKLGFQVLGVDNKPTAKHARAPVVNLDLRDSEQQARLWPEIKRAHAI